MVQGVSDEARATLPNHAGGSAVFRSFERTQHIAGHIKKINSVRLSLFIGGGDLLIDRVTVYSRRRTG
jgi:hypothetical protein